MATCKDCCYLSEVVGATAKCKYFDCFCGFFNCATEFERDLYDFYIGRQDAQYCSGFEQKDCGDNSTSDSGCFLTSACVDYMGKDDNCEELTVLRSFRDNYMTTIDGGCALIKQYYEIAPLIVEAINKSKRKHIYYDNIFKTIRKCVELCYKEKNEDVLYEYKSMVNRYCNEFKIQDQKKLK